MIRGGPQGWDQQRWHHSPGTFTINKDLLVVILKSNNNSNIFLSLTHSTIFGNNKTKCSNNSYPMIIKTIWCNHPFNITMHIHNWPMMIGISIRISLPIWVKIYLSAIQTDINQTIIIRWIGCQEAVHNLRIMARLVKWLRVTKNSSLNVNRILSPKRHKKPIALPEPVQLISQNQHKNQKFQP